MKTVFCKEIDLQKLPHFMKRQKKYYSGLAAHWVLHLEKPSG